MKNFMIYLSILMISNIYAQCDDYNQPQCSNDNNCEWVEDIETGNCGNLWGDDCELNPECNWNCDSVDDYMGWCTYSCYGGPYEIDNSYCQENEMPECSEMNELECSGDDSCDWTENIETGNCSGLGSSAACAEYSNYGCSWEFVYWCGYSSCFECTGGTYSYDNSYCEETEYQLGDLNQDSIINIQDIIIIINLILNGEFDLAADLNLDNTVNVLDVIQLVNIILIN